jgi:hypothetical protein
VHPIPQAAAAIELSYWLALTTFATLSTAITFPVPGYELALVEELAIVLAPSYGRPVSQELRDNAARSKGRIVEINGQIELGPPPAAPNQ